MSLQSRLNEIKTNFSFCISKYMMYMYKFITTTTPTTTHHYTPLPTIIHHAMSSPLPTTRWKNGYVVFSTHDNTKTTELVYLELYESMKSMVQSKMFHQNSSKLTTFHIPHTNSRKVTKQITIINAGTYTSTKHVLLIYPNTRNALPE